MGSVSGPSVLFVVFDRSTELGFIVVERGPGGIGSDPLSEDYPRTSKSLPVRTLLS